MKKQLSMFLVLALLTVLYGGAFADTLQLPGSLTAIEAESFSDSPALDEVSVAWGTEKIESRAFASSGVKKIYIPATVTAIADDAFAGTSVTICSAADAYAKEYADAHGLAWEDSESHDRKSAVSQLVDYSAKFRGLECEPLAMLDRLPTEGIEDPQELARVEQYNAAVDDLNADLASLNQHEAEIGDALNGCVDQLPALTVTERGGRVHMDMDGLSMVMDKTVMDAMEQGVEIVATDADDRGVTQLTVSNGATWYIYQIGDTYYYTGTAPSASAHVNDAIAEANGRDDGLLAKFTGLVDQVENIVSNVDLLFEDKLAFYNHEVDLAQEKFQFLNELDANMISDGYTSFENSPHTAKREKELNALKAKRARWIMGAKIWGCLDIVANIMILRQIVVDWAWLNEISDHKHPNEHDTSARSLDIANTMNRDIVILRSLFIADGILSVSQLISSIGLFAAAVPTGGAAVASKVVLSALQMIAGILFNAGEDIQMDAIDKAEKQLHTHVYGWVKDKDTGLTLEDVEVSDGLNKTRTDNFGYYELYIIPNSAMPERVTLIFEKETPGSREKRILKGTEEVELVLNEGVQCDAELEEIVPIDEEHFPDEKFREAVARRDTDANGLLTSSEREGGNLWVTGASNLEGIEYFPELEDLRLYSGAVSRLDLHDFANLKYLDCSYGQLSYLDVSGCTSLETLNCRDNRIFYLNINGATNIVTIIFDNNAPLSGVLDLSACHRLTIYKEDYRSEYYYVYDSGSERWVRTYWAFGTNLSRVYISRQSPAYAPIYEDIAPELTQDRYWGIIRIVD